MSSCYGLPMQVLNNISLKRIVDGLEVLVEVVYQIAIAKLNNAGVANLPSCRFMARTVSFNEPSYYLINRQAALLRVRNEVQSFLSANTRFKARQ